MHDLSNYIRSILYIDYNIPINGKTNLYEYPIAVFAPDVVMLPFYNDIYNDNKIHFCHMEYNNTKKTVISVPENTMRWICETVNEVQSKGFIRNKVNIEKELEEIKNSRSWRMLSYLKSRKDKGLGKILYKNLFDMLSPHF